MNRRTWLWAIIRSAGALALVLCVAAGCGDDDAQSGGDADGGGMGAAGMGGGGVATACERGCVATLMADCAMGPATQQECESDCERLRDGECGTEYRALMDCGEGEDVECSAQGLPVIPACAAEQAAFVSCL